MWSRTEVFQRLSGVAQIDLDAFEQRGCQPIEVLPHERIDAYRRRHKKSSLTSHVFVIAEPLARNLKITVHAVAHTRLSPVRTAGMDVQIRHMKHGLFRVIEAVAGKSTSQNGSTDCIGVLKRFSYKKLVPVLDLL